MSHARLLILLVGLTVLAASALAEETSNDSIVIDDKVIEVEARVRFDSLLQRSPDRSTAFQATWKASALVGAGGSTCWWHWSGSPDAAVQIQAELLRLPANRDFRKKSGWQVQLNVGMMAAALVEVDSGEFPDSLIGFVPSERNRPLRYVISQRFDIGTETDTLDAATLRSLQGSPFVAAGLTGYTGAWAFGIEAGVQYQAQPWSGRPVLQAPSLEGPAFLPAEAVPSGIQWRFSYHMSYHFPRSPWHVRWLGVWVPVGEQNHWLGAGVAYDAW